MSLPAPSADRAALITGASSGIGVEIARLLAARGHQLVLVARREDRMQALADELRAAHGVRVEVLGCDLTDAAARGALEGQIEALDLEVDVLINNAGYGSGGSFLELDRVSEVEMVRLNCETLVDLTARFAPAMAGRSAGAILNVGSVASYQPLPTQATYGASKAFALSFSEALHAELGPQGITVTALCPGPVRTEFFERAGISAADKLPDAIWATPQQCAKVAIEGLEHGKRVVIPGASAKVSALGGRYTPRRPLLAVLGRVYKAG